MEVIKIIRLGRHHLVKFYTLLDMSLFALFIVYFFYRIDNTRSMLPREYVEEVTNGLVTTRKMNHLKMAHNKVTSDYLAYMSISNLVLYFAMGMKLMSFMRFISSLG